MRRPGARAGAVAVALGLLGALGGCSLFDAAPDRPVEGAVKQLPSTTLEEASMAIDNAAAGIRIIEGVESVSSTLRQGERPDGLSPLPGQPQPGSTSWHGTISVDLEPKVSDLGRLATEVEEELAYANETVSTGGTLRVPADDRGPRATLSFLRTDRSNEIMPPDELATSLELLRDIDGATSAFVSQGDPVASVTVEDPSLWPGVSAQLRELPGLGFGALTVVSIDASTGMLSGQHNQLKIDATSPNPAFIPLLAELASDDTVVRLSYTGAKVESTASTASALSPVPLERPSLIVEVEGEAALDRVTDVLTGQGDAVTSVVGVGRAEFDVLDVLSDGDGSSGERTGLIGLPLGSPVPDDLTRAPAPAPATLVLDPGAADGRVAEDRALVTNLLDIAGDAAGIRGAPDTGFAECGQELGEHAEGEVVLPILEIATSTEAAYGAITAAWVASGYIPAPSAKAGLGVYVSPDSQSSGATTIAIRESAEGIRVYASSVCVVTGY